LLNFHVFFRLRFILFLSSFFTISPRFSQFLCLFQFFGSIGLSSSPSSPHSSFLLFLFLLNLNIRITFIFIFNPLLFLNFTLFSLALFSHNLFLTFPLSFLNSHLLFKFVLVLFLKFLHLIKIKIILILGHPFLYLSLQNEKTFLIFLW